jgi:hypothetical protein
MKMWISALTALVLAGGLMANDLDDHYAQLKDAQAKKDADAVKKLSVEAAKLAKAESATPQPTDASAVADWKQRMEFAKDVQLFAEYSLASTAITDQARVQDLVDTLLDLNPKSQYLTLCASSYLQALAAQSPEKELAGAQKILTANAANEDALDALARGYQSSAPDRANGYATRLIAAMKGKAKPEGVSDADWEKKKGSMLGEGYFIAGATACARSTWVDCDRNLKAAMPYIGKDQRSVGIADFYLGLANYQIGKLTGDRTKIQEGQKYSEQSAAIAGPFQQRASQNAAAMKTELAAPRR